MYLDELLLVANPSISFDHILRASDRQRRPAATLLFWEQIDRLSVTSCGRAIISIDGRPITSGARIIFIDYPHSATPLADKDEQEFCCIEWRSALASALSMISTQIVNGAAGETFVGRCNVLHLLMSRFNRDWAFRAEGMGDGRAFWLVFCGGQMAIWPETNFYQSIVSLFPDIHAKIEQVRIDMKLSFLVVKCVVTQDECWIEDARVSLDRDLPSDILDYLVLRA